MKKTDVVNEKDDGSQCVISHHQVTKMSQKELQELIDSYTTIFITGMYIQPLKLTKAELK